MLLLQICDGDLIDALLLELRETQTFDPFEDTHAELLNDIHHVCELKRMKFLS